MKTRQATRNVHRTGDGERQNKRGPRDRLRIRALLALLGGCALASLAQAGTLEQFIYDGVPGPAVSNLTAHPSFPTQPDLVLPFNLFTERVESAPGGQDYGSWTRGWLNPPQTGYYTFWLAADDSAELWLGTNTVMSPEPAQLVAQVLAPVARGEFNRYLPQKSAAIWLVRGEEYYFAVLHKQGEGEGFFQVGWQLPDGTIQRPLPLQYVQPFVPQSYSGHGVQTLAATPPEIHAFFSGTRLDVVSNQSVVLAPEVEARPPVSCQWYRNGTPIDGAILPWLAWLPDYASDDSAEFTLIVGNPDGFAISPDFRFNFLADQPVSFLALRAETLGNPNGFNVTFSRPVRPETATNAANYQIDHGITVLGVEQQYGTNTQVVVVHTTPLAPNVANHVVLKDIVATNGNPLPVGSRLAIQRGDGGIGVRTDVPPPAVMPLPCGGCPPTASTNLLTALETPELRDGNRAVNVRGYLTPTETADYAFHLSASGLTFLYLSADESPASKRLIALEPEWHLAREWSGADRRTRAGSSSPLIGIHFPQLDPGAPANQSEHTVGAIRLAAGRRYYIEADMPVGGGLNTASVLARKITDPLPPDGAPPIPGKQLAWLESDYARAPVAITRHPADTNVVQGRRAEFTADATGSPPLEPEWLRNGLSVADADQLTLTLPEAPLRDHQARYSVRVRNAFSEAISAEAILSVSRDSASPHLTRARGSQRRNDVQLTFDEFVRADLAIGTGPYQVVAEDDGTPLDVLAVELWGDDLNERFSEVRLITAEQMPGRRYVVSTRGQHDMYGNQSQGGTASFTAWVLTPGFVLHERYDNIVGGSVRTWNQPGKLPRMPSFMEYRNSWESEANVGDQFFARFSGLFRAAATGRHEFYLATDDSGELWLSTDTRPVELQRIAYEPTWGERRSWTDSRGGITDGFSNTLGQQLPILEMDAGEYRYLELLHKEGGGGDYADATYSGPGDPVPANGSLSTLVGPTIAAWADPAGAGVELLSQPFEVTLVEGQPGALTFEARGWTWLTNNSILAYQWQRERTNLHHGNRAAFTIQRARLEDDGARFRCGFQAPASAALMTGDIVLRVSPDKTAPRLLSAYPVVLNGYAGQYWVLRIDFNEPMDPAAITNIANYRVFIRHTSQEVPVLGAGPAYSTQDVALRIGYVEGPPEFEVHVRNLRDTSAAGNLIAPGDAFAPRIQLVTDTAPPGLRWNSYGDNRVLQSTGWLGPGAAWTNETGVVNQPIQAEFILPSSGPDKFYRLWLR